ncbi:hypothetical protein RB195_003386 [Necator americanus]
MLWRPTAAISKETSNSWKVVSRARSGVSYEVTVNESTCDCNENASKVELCSPLECMLAVLLKDRIFVAMKTPI